MNFPRSAALLMALALALPGAARACSVPVFRYALEHWTPDDYQALVFHRGPLAGPAAEAVARLRGGEGGARANLGVKVVDLAGPDGREWLPVWESLDGGELPWLLLRPDPRSGRDWARISMPLNPDTVAQLLDSPVRREIARRIGAGDSVVWLLLESGNREADDVAAKRLDERLAYLDSVLKLPELSEADIANGLVSVGAEGLKLRFSSLRVSQSDSEETLFVRQLLGLEHDLKDLGEPMVFPVYGQGRAMPPLVGNGIGQAMIDEDAIFLVGSCSCEVKDQNPGVDLLMKVDWVGMVKRQASAAPRVDPPASAAPEMVTFAAPVQGALESSPREALADEVAYGVPLILLLIAAAALSLRSH